MSSGTKRTNSAMGTGQTPPQNAICLLLGWTVLANKAEPIPSLLEHTHTHLHKHPHLFFFLSQLKYYWGQARRDQSGRLLYEGEKYFCVTKKPDPCFPLLHPAHRRPTALKRAPKCNISLIHPPQFSFIGTPSRRSGLQKPWASLWASMIPSMSSPWIKVVLHPHRC